MAFVSPLLYFFEGITHVDYGFGILHRIFGEYKFNKTHNLGVFDFTPVILTSLFDSGLICLFYGVWTSNWTKDLHVGYDGKNLSWQTKTVLNSVLLSLFQFWRHRTTLCVTHLFGSINFFTLLISLSFVLEDDNESGVISMVQSPYLLACILFFILVLIMKQHMRHFYIFWSPTSKLLV